MLSNPSAKLDIDVSMICIENALSSGQLHFPTLEAFQQYNNLIGLAV